MGDEHGVSAADLGRCAAIWVQEHATRLCTEATQATTFHSRLATRLRRGERERYATRPLGACGHRMLHGRIRHSHARNTIESRTPFRLLQWHGALSSKHGLPAEAVLALQEAHKAASVATKKAFKKALKATPDPEVAAS